MRQRASGFLSQVLLGRSRDQGNIPSHTVPHSLCHSDFSGRKKKSRCLLMSYMMMECSSPLFSKGSQGGDISSGKVGVCVNQLQPTPHRLFAPTRSHIGSTTWLTNRLWRIHGKEGGAETGNQPAEEEEKDNQTLIPGSFCRANKISPSAGRDHLSAGPPYPAPPCYDREYSRLSARLCCSARARLLREC